MEAIPKVRREPWINKKLRCKLCFSPPLPTRSCVLRRGRQRLLPRRFRRTFDATNYGSRRSTKVGGSFENKTFLFDFLHGDFHKPKVVTIFHEVDCTECILTWTLGDGSNNGAQWIWICLFTEVLIIFSLRLFSRSWYFYRDRYVVSICLVSRYCLGMTRSDH